MVKNEIKQKKHKSSNKNIENYEDLLIWTEFATRAGPLNALNVKHPVQASISTTHSAFWRWFAMAYHYLAKNKSKTKRKQTS